MVAWNYQDMHAWGIRAVVRAWGADWPWSGAESTPDTPQAAIGQFDRIIPLILNGRGFKTSFVLTNLDTKTIYFALYFNALDGNGALQFPISGIGLTSAIVGTLPLNQTITFATDGSCDLDAG